MGAWPRRTASRGCWGVVAALVRDAVRANLRMSRRIWLSRSPLPTGMVVLPTRAEEKGALAAVSLLTSLVVDNQLVDVDP